MRQLREVCGELLETLAGLYYLIAQGQCGQGAVAGGGEFAIDDMAGLLATKRIVTAQHLFKHVTVADVGLYGLDAHGTQGELKPQIAHHGHHQGVVIEFAGVLLGAGQNTHNLIAVDHVAILIHGQATVGIAIEGYTHGRIGSLDHGLQLLRMGGTGVLVDVIAIR